MWELLKMNLPQFSLISSHPAVKSTNRYFISLVENLILLKKIFTKIAIDRCSVGMMFSILVLTFENPTSGHLMVNENININTQNFQDTYKKSKTTRKKKFKKESNHQT